MDPRPFIRFVRIALVLASVGLATIPLLVMYDLARGGTGYGLCPGGVTGCRNAYSAAPELMILLAVSLMLVLAGFRITTRALRRLERHELPPHR